MESVGVTFVSISKWFHSRDDFFRIRNIRYRADSNLSGFVWIRGGIDVGHAL